MHGRRSLPIKIAIFLPNLAGGGAERVMLNLLEGFQPLGVELEVVLAEKVGEYLPTVPAGVKVVDLGSPRIRYSLPPLVRYLKQSQVDVFIASLGHANLIALLAKRIARSRAKIIITEHLAIDEQPEGWTDRVFRVLARRMYPRADAIVAVSDGVARTVAAGIRLPSESIRVIYNPVLTEAYWEKVKEAPPHPWFGPGEPPVLLGVGRLAGQKDFPNLLKAFAIIRESTQARLIILGEGPLRAELTELSKVLGVADYVDMPGFVDNPYSYMAASRAFVLSSIREGLPTVLIEALASGTAIVSTDCESGPREILDAGRLGALVPVRDEAALAAAIAATLKEELRLPADSDLAPYLPETAALNYLAAVGIHAPEL